MTPSPPPFDLDVHLLVVRQKPPLPVILDAVSRLVPGQALRLRAPFEPAPLHPLLWQRGFCAEPTPCGDGSWEVVFTPDPFA